MKRAALVLGLLLNGAGTAGAADLAGTLGWVQRAELGTLVSGVVSEVPVRVGQSVPAGAALLRLDDRGFKARVAETQAAVAKYQAHYAEAQREDERALELYERTVLSDHERQLAAIALQSARSDLQTARAQLTQARLDLERSAVLAPYAAVVLRVNAAPGQVVVSELQSAPLVVVAEDGRMLAHALATADQLRDVAVGMPAKVGVRDGWYDGQVAAVGLEAVADAVQGVARYELAVTFDVPADQRLRAGESATLRLGESTP